MNITLGRSYVDVISGFAGVAIGHCEYITGCNQTLIQPMGKADSKPESHWFDDQRLQVVPGPALTIDNGASPGCDKPAPRR